MSKIEPLVAKVNFTSSSPDFHSQKCWAALNIIRFWPVYPWIDVDLRVVLLARGLYTYRDFRELDYIIQLKVIDSVSCNLEFPSLCLYGW